MNNKKFFIILFFTALLSIGCAAKKNLFVLLPDPDGKVGEISVTSQKGTQVVSEANYATSLDSSDQIPSPPAPMDDKEISKHFGDALAAQPEPPVNFLLYFEKDSNVLTKESSELLPEIMKAIERRQSTDISVIGHTDRVGSKEYNLKLSFERAMQIGELLIFKGADPDSIEITSHGEENPLIKTEDEVEEPLNRRVEVIVR